MTSAPEAAVRLGSVLLCTALLSGLTGCPPSSARGVAPESRREALQRVNENLVRLTEPISAPAFASFEFVDAAGRQRTLIGYEARIFFRPPNLLLVEVRSLTGTVAQFGANTEKYWALVDLPDLKRLWYGTWRAPRGLPQVDLPIPPADLLDALMLRPLPETVDGGLLPVLRLEGDDHRLLFMRVALGGQPSGWREFRLDPAPPYQPLEIVDRDAEGRVLMNARLANYERIGPDGPYTPRSYHVIWPDRAEMRLTVTGVRWRPDLPLAAFDFPEGWQHERIAIDAREGQK